MSPLDMGAPPPLSRNGLAAIRYANAGFPVFPAGSNKRPLIENNLVKATTDPATIEAWWRRWPGASIAIPTGAQSGCIVLDLDVKDGKDGPATIRGLENEYGALPRGPVRLGGAGKQLFLECPKGLRVKTLAGQIGPGVDVRGCREDGSPTGFVIMPPSLRADGSAYSFGGDDEAKFLGKDFLPPTADWLFLFTFNAREREQLRALGIARAADFGGIPPTEWVGTFAKRLRERQLERLPRADKGKLLTKGGDLNVAAGSRLERYVSKAIEKELAEIPNAEPGCQERTINEAGLKINGLLAGAAVWGLKVDAWRDAAKSRYVAAVCAMCASRPAEPWTGEHAIAKWDHTAEGACPRELGHVLNDDQHFDAVATGFVAPHASADTTLSQSAPVKRSFRDRVKPLSFTYEDIAKIPPRKWLADRKFMRKKLSLLVAPGAAGKSLLTIQWGIALALGDGRMFGLNVRERVRTLLVNLEDEPDEITRRVAAVCMRFGIPPESLRGWLDIYQARDSDPKQDGFVAVKRNPSTRQLEHAGVIDLEEYARAEGIGAIIIDPLLETHEAKESDNDEMKAVMSAYRWVAVQADASVLLVHHTRKPGNADSDGHSGNMDTARGASSLVNGVRVGMTLFAMSAKDAAALNVPAADRRQYVGLDDSAKANLSSKTEGAEWYRWESVKLPNTDDMGVLVPVQLSASGGGGDGQRWEKALAYICERAAQGDPVATAVRGREGAGYYLSTLHPELGTKKQWEHTIERLRVSEKIVEDKNGRKCEVWLPSTSAPERHAQSGE